MILDSSMVEHAAVNRGVVGSSPTRGVKKPADISVCGLSLHKCQTLNVAPPII